MTGVDVSYVGNSTLRTGTGEELKWHGAGTTLPRSQVEPLGLAALRRAAKEMWEREIRLLELWIADVPAAGFDPEKVLIEDVCDVRLVAFEELHVVFPTGHTVDDDPAERDWIPAVLQPLLERWRARLVSVDVDPADPEGKTIVATIEPPWRGRTAADALRLGEEALALVGAMDGGRLGRATAADLVRTGHAAALVDQAEGPWLDGKRAPYELGSDGQKLELAKDVASFANSPGGGLIVIGARTASTADGDVIRDVKEVDLSLVDVPRMQAVIRDRVFPRVENLEICRVDMGGERGVAMIHVPPQAASRRPFLVRGTQIEGKVRTVFLGIPERDGEHVRWTDVATLHALLQAGQLANAMMEPAGLEPATSALQRRRSSS